MCCGMPEDMYEVVVIAPCGAARTDGCADAFAEAFLARERGERVVVILPRNAGIVARLRDALARSEVTILEGTVRRDADDDHYLLLDDRLVYGERVLAPDHTCGAFGTVRVAMEAGHG